MNIGKKNVQNCPISERYNLLGRKFMFRGVLSEDTS